MVIDKDFITLLTAGAMFVSSAFLSKKDKIKRRDDIVERTIKIKKETEDIVFKIFDLMEKGRSVDHNIDEIDEKIEQTIKDFWHQIDEIGSLHSVARLVNEDIIKKLFKGLCSLKNPATNVIENIFIELMYNGNVQDFAQKELGKSEKEVKTIESLNDIDIKLLGHFVQITYPDIWDFVWEYYETSWLVRQRKKLKKTIALCYKGIKDVLSEMAKPIFGSIIIYIFMKLLSKI